MTPIFSFDFRRIFFQKCCVRCSHFSCVRLLFWCQNCRFWCVWCQQLFLIPKHPNLMYVTSIFLFLMSLLPFSHSITSDLFFYKSSKQPFLTFDAIDIVYWTRNPKPVYKYRNNDASDINYRFLLAFCGSRPWFIWLFDYPQGLYIYKRIIQCLFCLIFKQ